jgi:hypothetical protein
MSQLEVDKVIPQSGTTLTLGESGDTITIASGATFTPTLIAPIIDEINDNNGNEEIIFTTTTSAVNELTIANAATGNAPEIAATGDDTDIDLKLTPKGAGNLVLDGIEFPNADGSAGEFLQTDGSGVLSFASAGAAAGQVIQVVTDKLTTGFTTSSQNVFVTTGQTLSITPSSASNKILVMFNAGSVTTLAANTAINVEVRRSGTTVCFGGYYTATVSGNQSIPFGVIHTLDSPNTTSAITYEVFAAEGGIPGTVSLNADRVLTLLEVKG